MDERMVVRCPNCGNLAQRIIADCLSMGHKCPEMQVTQTECPVCDYFMAMCSQNGRVLEAYAPGIQEKTFATAIRHSASSILDRWPNSETAIALLPMSSVMTQTSKSLVEQR